MYQTIFGSKLRITQRISHQMTREGNVLFPVFFRPTQLKILLVGAGNVGYEKLSFMYRHSGGSQIRVVAPFVSDEILKMAEDFPQEISIVKKRFSEDDLDGVNLVMVATDDVEINKEVQQLAKKRNILVNVADTPELCDFYLSSVVKKGDLKIAISSNGKSPTLTKRIREMLEDVLPEEIDDLLQSLQEVRNSLKGDFEYKVKELDKITSIFKERKK